MDNAVKHLDGSVKALRNDVMASLNSLPFYAHARILYSIIRNIIIYRL